MLVTMLFALTAAHMSGDFYSAGPFVVYQTSDGVVVVNGGKSITIAGGLNCEPSYSRRSNRLALGLIERVACIAPGPRVVKSIYDFCDADWAYASDPTGVYASNGVIFVTVGKVTAGPWAELQRLPKKQRMRELDKRLRVVALGYDGRVKWNKPQSAVRPN